MSGVDELVAFLRAALDRDEQSIRTWNAACFHIDACDTTGDYLERFDEDRMLAEVQAKRRILDEHGASGSWPPGRETCISCGAIPGGRVSYPCLTVRLLAQPYAGQDGWREEWRA